MICFRQCLVSGSALKWLSWNRIRIVKFVNLILITIETCFLYVNRSSKILLQTYSRKRKNLKILLLYDCERWSGSAFNLDPRVWIRIRFEVDAGSGSALRPKRGRNTCFVSTSRITRKKNEKSINKYKNNIGKHLSINRGEIVNNIG